MSGIARAMSGNEQRMSGFEQSDRSPQEPISGVKPGWASRNAQQFPPKLPCDPLLPMGEGTALWRAVRVARLPVMRRTG